VSAWKYFTGGRICTRKVCPGAGLCGVCYSCPVEIFCSCEIAIRCV
jgi:hypothetical protein